MSRLRDWFGGRSEAGLRRVSIERARAVGRASHRQPLPQAGEKILVAGVGAVLTTLLLGVGAGLSLAGWFGLLALVCLAIVLFESYLVDFRREALSSLSRVIALLVLGGEIIFDFAFALLVGVLIGTYSSIYVASPLVLRLNKGQRPRSANAESKAPAPEQQAS